MMLKILGASMIALSCFATSATLVSYERKKLRQLDSFTALIRYIRNQIDFYSVPIDRILSECPSEILDELGGRESKMTLEGLVKREAVIIEGEGRRIISELASSFGKNYRERQVKLCDNALSGLETIRTAEQKNFSARKKTVNALCAAVGGLAVILLL